MTFHAHVIWGSFPWIEVHDQHMNVTLHMVYYIDENTSAPLKNKARFYGFYAFCKRCVKASLHEKRYTEISRPSTPPPFPPKRVINIIGLITKKHPIFIYLLSVVEILISWCVGFVWNRCNGLRGNLWYYTLGTVYGIKISLIPFKGWNTMYKVWK